MSISKISYQNHPYLLEKFDICMGKNSSIYFKNFSKNELNIQNYNFFKELYIKNYIDDTSKVSEVKIPKIIHQIWLGPKEIPEKFHSFMASWKKFNPDWQYVLWTDNEVKNFKFIMLKPYFEKSKNFGQKSDMLRYEILYKYGGLYADIDFECIANFDILNKNYHFYCGIHPPHTVITPDYPLEIGNAIIGSIPYHPILINTSLLIKEGWSKIYNNNKYDDNWRVVLSTMYPLKEAIIACAYKDSLINIALPPFYLFPFLPARYVGNIEKGKGFSNIQKETIAIHHWGESWFHFKY